MKAGTYIVPLFVLMMGGCLPSTAQSVSGIVNTYFSITTVSTLTNSIIVDNAAGLVSGQRVLIIQSKGAAISSTNDVSFGNVTAIGSAGNYEFNTICSVDGNQVWLKGPFVNAYDPTGQLQLVAVPTYQSITLSATVSGLPWDPVAGKGGIVAIEAADTIYLNADVDVSGLGFRGGALVNYPVPPYNCSWNITVDNYYLSFPASGDYTGGKKGEGIAAYIPNEEYGRGMLANGGGGGNNANTGGAGGGQYGAGGNGGQRAGESIFDCHGAYPGIGGLGLASYGYAPGLNRIFFGGGGGSGHENNGAGLPGGNGGGILLLSASVIVGGGGNLFANGLSPVNPVNTDPAQAEGDGGGGGGAGGVVIVNAATVTGLVGAAASGARGSDASNEVDDCTGPGGGGAGGVIWSSGPVFPAAVSPIAAGGSNGVVSAGSTKASCRGSANGASPGAPGISQPGYTAPESVPNVCTLLASPLLKYFSGVLTTQGSLLTWALYPAGPEPGIRSFTIERSVGQGSFTALATVAGATDTLNYRYIDPSIIAGTVYYRLALADKSGARSYSPVIALTRQADPVFGFVGLHPNPASDLLSVALSSADGEAAVVRIYNAYEQQVSRFAVSLHAGITTLNLPVYALADGAYFLVVDAKDRKVVRSFIKQ